MSLCELAKILAEKKAVINLRNETDNECLNKKRAITSAIYPPDKDSQRFNCEMRANAGNLDWKGISFLSTWKDITKFEKQNPYKVNVFWYGSNVYPLRMGSYKNEDDDGCKNIMVINFVVDIKW